MGKGFYKNILYLFGDLMKMCFIFYFSKNINKCIKGLQCDRVIRFINDPKTIKYIYKHIHILYTQI